MITHDRDGLSPVQIARINRLQLAHYRKPLTETEQLAQAHRVLRRGIIIVGIIWILGLAVLFYTVNPRHGRAVYLPGGIEVYP